MEITADWLRGSAAISGLALAATAHLLVWCRASLELFDLPENSGRVEPRVLT